MAGGKEIRTKIKSVQNTKKITKAMEMVAASKMRRAQERMRHARPYAEKVRRLAANLSSCFGHRLQASFPDASRTGEEGRSRAGGQPTRVCAVV